MFSTETQDLRKSCILTLAFYVQCILFIEVSSVGTGGARAILGTTCFQPTGFEEHSAEFLNPVKLKLQVKHVKKSFLVQLDL